MADLFKEKASETFNQEDLEGAFSEIAKVFDEREESLNSKFKTQQTAFEELRTEFNTLKEKLSKEPAKTQTFTPVVQLENPNSDGFGKTEY
ncbi:hypothetical protein MMG00_12930 [Ignatzschineria rhizosphaerae]|uniref:Phage capsid protein n=1 Tax=Ignatzschineria rhizosphaerae TaxID=2923279 RepID=A0ABY3X2G5_9GAMM|nr:hypothetical protein [Ignatzschineria rhizosphaerae]UNM96085.1 hypothetical protein MMG00_12930 [Ignatzschineria rhizosphaerae]